MHSRARIMKISVPENLNTQNLDSMGNNILEKLREIGSSPEGFIEQVGQLDAITALALVVIGLISLFWGWRIFKLLVVANAAVVGLVIGAYLGQEFRQQGGDNIVIFAALAGGLVMAALAWPLMKYAVSIMGALAGSVIGYGAWHYGVTLAKRPELTEHAWAGALIGLILLGLLAFLIFKTVVMVLTALEGASLTVAGVVSMCLRYERISEDVRSALTQHPNLLPLLIAVPTVIGFAMQYAASAKKAKKKRKAMEGDGG